MKTSSQGRARGTARHRKRRREAGLLAKATTGIPGLDAITEGGLPRGRPTLICGGAGSGKTVFAMQFLVHGALKAGEPGVFVSFEEAPHDLAINMRSWGVNLESLARKRLLSIEHIRIERNEIEQSGEYDLEGLFIRLDHAVKAIGARRIVLDTIESLFGALPNQAILRAELRRLFAWLRSRSLTAIVTAERGAGELTRSGMDEYVSDCVIVLDHRVSDEVSKRRLYVAKYRGTAHGTNEYPFLINRNGIQVMPVTTLGLDHDAPVERVSTGIPRLDVMLGGRGFYRGSTVLVSGTAGAGKTSISAQFVDAACRRGERCLYFLFEESPRQMIRNMRSIGIDLGRWTSRGLLTFSAARPTAQGIEELLLQMQHLIERDKPAVVVVDPVSDLSASGDQQELAGMLQRLVSVIKTRGATAILTDLTSARTGLEQTSAWFSSQVDSWLVLRDIEHQGERTRALYIIKSRGMPHSGQIREFRLTSKGIELADVYLGPSGVLTGTARLAQEARDRAELLAIRQEIEGQMRVAGHRHQAHENEATALRARLAAEDADAEQRLAQLHARERSLRLDRQAMKLARGGNAPRAAASRRTPRES